MKTLMTYVRGFLIGMIAEYLIRVKFDIIPLILLILLVAYVIYDLLTESNSHVERKPNR